MPPFTPALPPKGGLRFICITRILGSSWYNNAIATGAPQACGALAPGASAFLVPEQGCFFDLNFKNSILTIFSLVISLYGLVVKMTIYSKETKAKMLKKYHPIEKTQFYQSVLATASNFHL